MIINKEASNPFLFSKSHSYFMSYLTPALGEEILLELLSSPAVEI